MIIDLKRVATYWLTCEKTKHRWSRVEATLENLKFTNTHKVVGPVETPYTTGIAKTHMAVLRDYIHEDRDLPILLLEDDIAINSSNSINLSEINIPSNCDALYLGTSTFGRFKGGSHNGYAIAIDAGNYLKPINMLGIHAVLYLKVKYAAHVYDTLERFIQNPIGGCEDKIAETMVYHNILAVKTPVFYQDDGHSYTATLTPVVPIF